jgi:hypothetical protein
VRGELVDDRGDGTVIDEVLVVAMGDSQGGPE